MPTYEYACRDCGESLEVVQSFSDAALTECPACGGSLRKVFSAAGIIFKGSGWHIKDYSSSKATTADPGNGSSSNGDGAKDGGSSGDGAEKKDAPAAATTSSSSSSSDAA